VQLSNVVRTEVGAGPNSIYHYNRWRSTNLEGTPLGVTLGTAIERVEQMLAADMPPGFRYEWAGESRDFKETGQEAVFVLALALIVIYLTLAAQFESWIHPLTVMLAVPLAAFGALGALWLMAQVNQLGVGFHGWAHFSPDPPPIAHWLSRLVPRIPGMTLNLFSQIGIVLLLGLVTKNSILLVEFANQQMARGASAHDAMVRAGLVRLRPILMTSFSTIMGILPIAIGFGAGAESRRPMGVAAVGGMITSTFLTLVVIPVVYVLFDALRQRLRRRVPVTAAGSPVAAPVPLESSPVEGA
jgi:multidrug efflux pump